MNGYPNAAMAQYGRATNLYAQAAVTTRGPVASYVMMFDHLVRQISLARDSQQSMDLEHEDHLLDDCVTLIVRLRGLIARPYAGDGRALADFYNELIERLIDLRLSDDPLAAYDGSRQGLIQFRNCWAQAGGHAELPIVKEEGLPD